MAHMFFDEGSYCIEQAKESDAIGVALLYKRVWNAYRNKFPEELIKARQPTVEQMREWMKNDTYFVVRKRSQIIGVAGCSLKHGTCLIAHMVVDKKYRKRGIGSALTKRAVNYAKESSASKVWLDTIPNLKEAIDLYEKHGFVRCGHLRKHYWGLDIYLYELILKNNTEENTSCTSGKIGTQSECIK